MKYRPMWNIPLRKAEKRYCLFLQNWQNGGKTIWKIRNKCKNGKEWQRQTFAGSREMRTRIVYEDTEILVVQKPAGIAVQTAQVGRQDVVSELKNYLGKNPYLGVIHRLDQPVEGLLVFAKNPKAAAALSEQVKKEDFCKEYMAVVCGKPESESGRLVDYLVKEGTAARVSDGETGAKRAALCYERVQSLQREEENMTLLKIRLETGRFHQIRVQLSHAGYPILGDMKYGSVLSADMSAKEGVRHVALCAYRLCFVHPVLKKKMEYIITPQGEIFKKFSGEQ